MPVILRGALVVVCAVSAMALGAQSARAEPKPEVPPPSHGAGSPQPSPTPSATATPTTSGATSSASSRVSTSTPAASRVVGTTATVHHPATVSTSSPSQSHTPRSRPARTATQKPLRPPLFELRVLTGLRDLPSVASSDGSGWLLAAGFALVLLVIAETSFLGLASFRFGAGGGPRTPSRSRSADEPLAIRRVQLRR